MGLLLFVGRTVFHVHVFEAMSTTGLSILSSGGLSAFAACCFVLSGRATLVAVDEEHGLDTHNQLD